MSRRRSLPPPPTRKPLPLQGRRRIRRTRTAPSLLPNPIARALVWDGIPAQAPVAETTHLFAACHRCLQPLPHQVMGNDRQLLYHCTACGQRTRITARADGYENAPVPAPALLHANGHAHPLLMTAGGSR